MSIVRWTQRRFPVPIWMKLRANRFQDSAAESLVRVIGIRSEKAGMTEYEPAALAGQNIRPSHRSEGRISPMRPLA